MRARERGDMGGVWSMCPPAIISVTVFSIARVARVTDESLRERVFDAVSQVPSNEKWA
jgi:hypothetical protein